MAQLFTKKDNDQRDNDRNFFLRITWSDHLKSVESSVYESSIMHGITSPPPVVVIISCWRSEKRMNHEYVDIQICACKLCGQDHGAVNIKLEDGGIITTTTSAFGSKTKTKKHKIADRYLSPDIFWPKEEEVIDR